MIYIVFRVRLNFGVINGTLQLRCKFRYSHKMLSVCLSVTRVYCAKTAEARIMQFSLKCSPMP